MLYILSVNCGRQPIFTPFGRCASLKSCGIGSLPATYLFGIMCSAWNAPPTPLGKTLDTANEAGPLKPFAEKDPFSPAFSQTVVSPWCSFNANRTLNHSASHAVATLGPRGQWSGEGHYGLQLVGTAQVTKRCKYELCDEEPVVTERLDVRVEAVQGNIDLW